MELAGLGPILELCLTFGFHDIDAQVVTIRRVIIEDEKMFRERFQQEKLGDLTNPQDVFNAIHGKTKGTRATNYFLSMMQHLLLIREDGQPMVHYFQLLDSIVTDVVMEKKLPGAEQRLGFSVSRIIAQFNEADRYQRAEDEAAEARAHAVRLKLEKEALEDELYGGLDGLVGRLKSQVLGLEEKLSVTRETTTRLHGQLESQKVSYEDRIAQLEAQIIELFRMLKEVGKGMETILDNGENMDRKLLVENLERSFQRHKTINILEGKMGSVRRRRKNKQGSLPVEAEEDVNTTPRKPGVNKGQNMGVSTSKGAAVDETGRVSQFMDADEADAREQVQQQIAAGVKLASFFPIISISYKMLIFPSVFPSDWLIP